MIWQVDWSLTLPRLDVMLNEMQNETMGSVNQLSPSVLLPGGIALYAAIKHRDVQGDIKRRASSSLLAPDGSTYHQPSKQRDRNGQSEQRLSARLFQDPFLYEAFNQQNPNNSNMWGINPPPVSEDMNLRDVIGAQEDDVEVRASSSYGHAFKNIAQAVPVVLPPVLDTANRVYDFFRSHRRRLTDSDVGSLCEHFWPTLSSDPGLERQLLRARSVVDLDPPQAPRGSEDLSLETFNPVEHHHAAFVQDAIVSRLQSQDNL